MQKVDGYGGHLFSNVLTDVCVVVVGCSQGMAKQNKIKARLNDEEQAATIDGYGDGRSSIPDQRTISTRSKWPLKILTWFCIAWCAMVVHWWVKHSFFGIPSITFFDITFYYNM